MVNKNLQVALLCLGPQVASSMKKTVTSGFGDPLVSDPQELHVWLLELIKVTWGDGDQIAVDPINQKVAVQQSRTR